MARQIKDGYLGEKKKVHNYQLRAYAGSQFPHLLKKKGVDDVHSKFFSEKRYLYLNRIYWPPQRQAFQHCPEASGQGLPLQQENSQWPQHSPTPFTASPNFIHSACPAQENCTCQALSQRTQRAGHSSWEGALVPWQQQVAPTYQTSPVVPSVSRGHLLGGSSQQGSRCPPWGV